MSSKSLLSRLLLVASCVAAVHCGDSTTGGDSIGPDDVVVGFSQTSLQTKRATPFNITVKLNKAATADVVLAMTMTGAAPFAEVGFNGLEPDGSFSLTVPAGQTTGSVAATANLTSDAARTVVFHLNSVTSGGAKIDPAAKDLSVTIGGGSNNDGPTISLSAFNAVVGEGAFQSASINISSNQSIATPVTVHFTLTGTATPGSDYTSSVASEVVIPPGQTTASVTITPVNDTDVEPFSETVILTVTSVDGGSLAAGTQPAVITITDDEAITFTASEASVSLDEGGSHEVTLSLPTTFDRKAEVSIISDTPGEGTLFNFTGLTNGKLVFPAGQKTAKFTFQSIDDSSFACSYAAPVRFYGFFLDGDKDDPNFPINGRQVDSTVTFNVTENDPVTANDRIEFEFNLDASESKEIQITDQGGNFIYKGTVGSHYVSFWFDTNQPLPEGTTTVSLMKEPAEGGATRSFTLSTSQPNVCETKSFNGSMILNDTSMTPVLYIHRNGVNVWFELPVP